MTRADKIKIQNKKIEEKLNNLEKFDKDERSSFKYWYNHWLAYNLVAMKLRAWKFKYLFHDWYKPWLRLFMPYEKLQKFHRKHARHHIEWLEEKIKKNGSWKRTPKYLNKFDFKGAAIDWECSRYTKYAAQLTAYEEYRRIIFQEYFKKRFPEIYHGCYEMFSYRFYDALEKLNLIPID